MFILSAAEHTKRAPSDRHRSELGPYAFATKDDPPRRKTHSEIRHTADTTTTVHQNTTTPAAGNRYKVGGSHILSETDLLKNPHFEAHSKIGELRERAVWCHGQGDHFMTVPATVGKREKVALRLAGVVFFRLGRAPKQCGAVLHLLSCRRVQRSPIESRCREGV